MGTMECICKDCGETYQAKVVVVLGVDIVLGRLYCPGCGGKRLKEIEAREEAARLAEIAATRLKWRRGCGISRLFMAAEFGVLKNFKYKQIYKNTLDYADGFPLNKRPYGYPSLVLTSAKSWGVGKTHLACSIIHRILNRWDGEDISNPVLFVSEPDLFRSIRATYSFSYDEKRWRESEEDIINRLCRVSLLVLDDVGKEETSDPRFVQRILYAIIDNRYKNMLPIIITANLDKEGLAAHLGGSRGNEASFDRLVGMCRGKILQMDGASYRRQGW